MPAARSSGVSNARSIAAAHGARASVDYRRGYPPTVNHAAETELALSVAEEVCGGEGVLAGFAPSMGSEDFAYMLEARPGAFIFCGNGHSAGLHHPAYNFNDEAIVFGTSYLVKLVEESLAASYD